MCVYMYMYMDVHDQSQTKRMGQLFHGSAQPCYSLLAELFCALKYIMIIYTYIWLRGVRMNGLSLFSDQVGCSMNTLSVV